MRMSYDGDTILSGNMFAPQLGSIGVSLGLVSVLCSSPGCGSGTTSPDGDVDATPGSSDVGSSGTGEAKTYAYFRQDSGCTNYLEQYIKHFADDLTAELHDIDCSTGVTTHHSIESTDLIILKRAHGTVVYDGRVYRTISSNPDQLSPPTEFAHAFCYIEEPNDDLFYYRLLLYSEDIGDSFYYTVDHYSSSINPQDGYLYHNEGSYGGANVVLSTTELLIDFNSTPTTAGNVMSIDLTSKNSSKLYTGTLTLGKQSYAAICAVNSDFL